MAITLVKAPRVLREEARNGISGTRCRRTLRLGTVYSGTAFLSLPPLGCGIGTDAGLAIDFFISDAERKLPARLAPPGRLE